MVRVDLDGACRVVLEEVSVLLECVDDGVQFLVADWPSFFGVFEFAGVEYNGSGYAGLGVGLADDRGIGVSRGVSFQDCRRSVPELCDEDVCEKIVFQPLEG